MATSVASLPRSTGMSWSSIFAGTFMFLAIEVTFGVLGVAIFASGVNVNSANPVGKGVSAGLGIWMLVLSIIALYFAGKTASRIAGVADRNRGVYHGLVTYGMCIFTSILTTSLLLGSTVAGQVNPARVSPAAALSTIVTGGWWLFFVLLLGMIAAWIGGSAGARGELRLSTMERVNDTRSAA